MRTTKLIAGLLLSLVLIGGCANSSYQPISITEDKRQNFQSVAIVVPPEPVNIRVVPGMTTASFALMPFGALGGLGIAAIEEANIKEHSFKLWQTIKEPKPPYLSNLTQRVADNLRQAGYQTKVVEGGWTRQEERFVLSPTVFQTGADSTMILRPPKIALIAPGSGSAFKAAPGKFSPMVQMEVRVYDGKTVAEVYRGIHSSGENLKMPGHVFSGTTGKVFSSFDAMLENPESVRSALRATIDLLAKSIASVLDKSVPPVDFEAVMEEAEAFQGAIEEK